MPHPPHIHVNEIGGRVISDSAAAQRERSVAQIRSSYTGDSNINRFSFHMQALLRNAGGVGSQKFVRLGSPVAANNIDLRIPASN